MQGLESWHLCLPVPTVCLHADFFFLFLADEQLIFLSGSWAERETAGGFSR